MKLKRSADWHRNSSAECKGLGGAQFGVAQPLLHDPHADAHLQQVGAKCLAQLMHGQRSTGSYDVAFIDLGMPGMAGDRVSQALRESDPALATVLVTGWALADGDPRLSAFDFYLRKPFDDVDEILDIAARAIELHAHRAGQDY